MQKLARDLRKTPPRSPRETFGGFVIAARMLDKARADLLGINGEYNFYRCGLGAYFWKFTGLDIPGTTKPHNRKEHHNENNSNFKISRAAAGHTYCLHTYHPDCRRGLSHSR